jgi:hypothetical protein
VADGNFKLAGFKLRVTGLRPGALVLAGIAFFIIAGLIVAGLIALLVHNVWIAYTGEATGWNFLFIVLLTIALLAGTSKND